MIAISGRTELLSVTDTHLICSVWSGLRSGIPLYLTAKNSLTTCERGIHRQAVFSAMGSSFLSRQMGVNVYNAVEKKK